MIKLILLIIIISIILEHLSFFNEIQQPIKKDKKQKKIKNILSNNEDLENKQQRIMTFDQPQPWSKITFDENNKYPYTFFIKLDIPTFNDYHNWKQIIPTLNFLPHTKELAISTINEEIALAIINLVILTFSNKITFDDIISKDLINISISKAQSHPDIKLSFKNQIIEYLYTPQYNELFNESHNDTSKVLSIEQLGMKSQVLDSKTSLLNEQLAKSEFLNLGKELPKIEQQNDFIAAYDGSDYSYL